jgi:hypothetical protein
VSSRRISRSDDSQGDHSGERLFPVLAAEVTRNASAHRPMVDSKGAEERMGIFWRVFGGTILSISALVGITVYQSIAGGIKDLRTEIARLNEAKADYIKKDEYANNRAKTWDRIQEVSIQAQLTTSLKDRIAALEEQRRSYEADRRETHELHATIKERLLSFETQLKNNTVSPKDLQQLQSGISSLQEKMAGRDMQLKQADDERKEAMREIQLLRERLAKVEVANAARPDLTVPPVPAPPVATVRAPRIPLIAQPLPPVKSAPMPDGER